jgi:hypothetical protein
MWTRVTLIWRKRSSRRRQALPGRPPFETYCHTLTDDSILSPALGLMAIRH